MTELAEILGNTEEICRNHYSKWDTVGRRGSMRSLVSSGMWTRYLPGFSKLRIKLEIVAIILARQIGVVMRCIYN